MPFNRYGVWLRVTHPSFSFLYQPAPPPILRNATVEQKNVDVWKYLNPAVSTSPESLGERLLFTFLLLIKWNSGEKWRQVQSRDGKGFKTRTFSLHFRMGSRSVRETQCQEWGKRKLACAFYTFIHLVPRSALQHTFTAVWVLRFEMMGRLTVIGDEIWSHLRHTPLNVSVKASPERFDWAEKTQIWVGSSKGFTSLWIQTK